ncbi:MAG TPA: TraB/GumN family protein, partial [Verrucomicrobiae bacterium]|nr:TraB/GumN family protein [Verrucomicrobiae bacterium]
PVYTSFSNHVTRLGMSMVIFDRLKPSLAAATLELFELKKLGLDPEYGVDQYFFNRARKRGDRIVPLETVDFQVNLATEFSQAEGELLMKSSLEEIDETRKLFGKMITAWKTGDSKALARLLNSSMRETPSIYKRLVTDRNKRWVPKIEELLRGKQNAIVIVGAGHLVGKEGVVELLRKRGWRIVQL